MTQNLNIVLRGYNNISILREKTDIQNSESNMAADKDVTPEWTILYHAGKFKGRGEFLRLMFEDKGVPYVNSAERLYGPEGVMDAFRGSPEAIQKEIKDLSFPLLFPPAIRHKPKDGGEEVLINQTAACMIYIGDRLDYAPSSLAEKARANAILLNSMDYIAEGRSSFHPVNNSASYNDQKEEGDRVSKEFSQTRMKTYLLHFNNVVKCHGGSKSPVAGGSSITYADFALFHVLDATVFQFNNEKYDFAWDKLEGISALKEYYDWMRTRPNLQKYFESDRCIRKYYFVVDSRRLRLSLGFLNFLMKSFFKTAINADPFFLYPYCSFCGR